MLMATCFGPSDHGDGGVR